MDNLYYTPSLEEFHIGFEYEWKDEKDSWNKTVPTEITSDFYEEQTYGLRVKYLDKEDIESLGFKYEKHGVYKKYVESKWTNPSKKVLIRLDYKPDTHLISIEYYYKNTFDSGLVFTIKNKSELRVLLKQLGIDE